MQRPAGRRTGQGPQQLSIQPLTKLRYMQHAVQARHRRHPPALATIQSRRPNWSTACFTAASTCAGGGGRGRAGVWSGAGLMAVQHMCAAHPIALRH